MTISHQQSDEETSLFRMMLRPKWLGLLFVALLMAAIFAWLGQWQLQRAIDSGKVIDAPTETVLPLMHVARPAGPISDKAVGQKVVFTGSFSPTDYNLLQGRLNYGKAGYWIVAHVTLSEHDSSGAPVAIAVARGWAPDLAAADSAVRRLKAKPAVPVTITGRILPTEAPEVPNASGNPNVMQDMSSAALLNLWTNVDDTDVFEAYVIEKTPPAGLDAIYAPPPIETQTLDWLNLFYAAEWVIFAGFAFFFWYRLVKDAKEKEDEERLEALGLDTAAVKVN